MTTQKQRPWTLDAVTDQRGRFVPALRLTPSLRELLGDRARVLPDSRRPHAPSERASGVPGLSRLGLSRPVRSRVASPRPEDDSDGDPNFWARSRGLLRVFVPGLTGPMARMVQG